MSALATDLRKRLEKTIQQARASAEAGAMQALEALAVGGARAHKGMRDEDAALRRRLRAHGRQLGDERKESGEQGIDRLRHEVAYEHWHRMLFARFLAENDLLTEPESGVAISLDECRDLARERGDEPFALAASFAEDMLPQIFRTDDPALDVTLPPETRQSLRALLSDLPRDVFTADDALGWTYQFWQSAEKKAVNARRKSGEKITGQTLPAVTQLFTEPYMVKFLLHNTIGAWHAGKVFAQNPELATSAASEQQLRDAVALDGYTFDYLRFVREPREGDEEDAPTGPWRPAAGTYEKWPKQASEVTVLDPCCGSGHFLVAAFDLLVRLRRAEEGLELDGAIGSVLKDNVFGLELDGRCTQIAAFHLAIAAWRTAGRSIDLPRFNLACSGIGPQATKDEWLVLAETAAAHGGMPAKKDLLETEDSLLSSTLKSGLTSLHEQFALAPELGSLIDPTASAGPLFSAGYDQLQPLLERVLEAERADAELQERAVAAYGMAKAARILTRSYTLVITNVPYLGRGDQAKVLREYAESHHKEARNDLASVFVSRMLRWIDAKTHPGTIAAVTPQNWLTLTSYRKLRTTILTERSWEVVARLGSRAFETVSGEVVNVALVVVSASPPSSTYELLALDASSGTSPSEKARTLLGASGETVSKTLQRGQLGNPDARFTFEVGSDGELLSHYADCLAGINTGDYSRWGRQFWELPSVDGEWVLQQSTTPRSSMFSGLQHAVKWCGGGGEYRRYVMALDGRLGGSWKRGRNVWGRRGVAVSQMGDLPVSLYLGGAFDSNVCMVVPFDERTCAALYLFLRSDMFANEVRRLDPKMNITNATIGKVRLDASRWRADADVEFPSGLPDPRSDAANEGCFHGHPASAALHMTLQVAVARLLGYRWPPELDPDMRLAEEARGLVARCEPLAGHTDSDGIVSISALQGEAPAVDRLRALLADAFGDEWSAAKETDLLAAAGEQFHKGRVQRSLAAWLRDRFFIEHCALFHKRPFIWHVWDGHPEGFSALVNYHRLAGPDGEGLRTLEALTYTYLGAWITRQRQKVAAGEEGADGRLAAALVLDEELRKLIEGEPPYDIFVRWKPLQDQPLGWAPDIDDGVRLNIRPLLKARDIKTKNAGILRAKPDATWSKPKKLGVRDRGKEPASLRPKRQFPWFWGCDPDAHLEHRIDFGAETPGAAPAGEDFDGVRWNGLHYTRAAKEAARRRARDGDEGGANS